MEVITNAPIYVEGNESFLNVGGKDKKNKDKKTGEKLAKGWQNVKESDLGKFIIASGGKYLVDKYGNSTYAGGGGDGEGGSGAPSSELPPVGDDETKSKMSTGAKVAIGVTAAVVIGVVIYFATRKTSKKK